MENIIQNMLLWVSLTVFELHYLTRAVWVDSCLLVDLYRQIIYQVIYFQLVLFWIHPQTNFELQVNWLNLWFESLRAYLYLFPQS